MVLGVVTLAGGLLRLLRGIYLPVEVGAGPLWLWFGWQVQKGCDDFRKLAILLCSAVVLLSVVMLPSVLATGTPWHSLRILCFDVPNPSLTLTATALLLAALVGALPLVALLHPRTRRAYRSLPRNKDPLDIDPFARLRPPDASVPR
jgi:hypothetical protein